MLKFMYFLHYCIQNHLFSPNKKHPHRVLTIRKTTGICHVRWQGSVRNHLCGYTPPYRICSLAWTCENTQFLRNLFSPKKKAPRKVLFCLVETTGLEPVTSRMWSERSNQLRLCLRLFAKHIIALRKRKVKHFFYTNAKKIKSFLIFYFRQKKRKFFKKTTVYTAETLAKIHETM